MDKGRCPDPIWKYFIRMKLTDVNGKSQIKADCTLCTARMDGYTRRMRNHYLTGECANVTSEAKQCAKDSKNFASGKRTRKAKKETITAAPIQTSPSHRILDCVIKLNVGGTKFTTSGLTLSKSGYFRALLSGKFVDILTDDGYWFIDRDPVIFEYLLNYMRCDYVSILTKHLHQVQLEAKHLQIDLDLSFALKQVERKHHPDVIAITMGPYDDTTGNYYDGWKINNQDYWELESMEWDGGCIFCDRTVFDFLRRLPNDDTVTDWDPMMLAEDIVALGTGWEIAFVSKRLDPTHGQPTKILLKRPAQKIPASFVVEKQRGH